MYKGIAGHPGLGASAVAPLQGAGYRLTACSQGFADGNPSASTLGGMTESMISTLEGCDRGTGNRVEVLLRFPLVATVADP